MKKYVTVVTLIAVACTAVHAQGEIDLQQKVFYRNEWSLALMLNSNGFGGNYRYGKHINARTKKLWEMDFVYMKAPKDYKTYSPTTSGAKFVYGKKNLAFDWRVALGRQYEIFRKHDVGSVAIRYFYNYGPSVVMLKPVYYNVGDGYYDPVSNLTYVIEREEPERFDPDWINMNVAILSRASFFKGFDKLSLVPGAFGKFGLNVEYSKQDKVIHALECGMIVEGFIKKVEIMDFSSPPAYQSKTAKNQQFFLTLFVSYRFGRIVDPYEVKKERKRSNEISY
ncbi:MAG: hypothetical protein LBF89_05835 [Bacteroidales bacterium]|jgi:hypothetical protein|nr:hypothetical protein [Bacteroidales bacterium]